MARDLPTRACVTPSLNALFASGGLIRPADDSPNFVHLIRAIYRRAGIDGLGNGASVDELLSLIPPVDHIIFILLDGLGCDVAQQLGSDSFIRRRTVRSLHAICPSTTACALTTAATAAYPGQHGVAGWFTFIPEIGMTILPLPFSERLTADPLARRGIAVESVLPLPSICSRLERSCLTITPALLTHTPYNHYIRGGTPGVGYTSIANAVDQAIAHIAGSSGPTYTHVYLPEVDSLCHKRGTSHPDVLALVQSIDQQFQRLEQSLAQVRPGGTVIIVTADHGLINVPPTDQTILFKDDPMLKFLVIPPTGDARLPIFHVLPDRHEEFRAEFRKRLGHCMMLVSTDEAAAAGFFGPEGISANVRSRFGDYIGLATCAATVAFHPPGRPLGHLFPAVHGGLSPQEMLVPLCVA